MQSLQWYKLTRLQPHAMVKKGMATVETIGLGDKPLITATFVITLDRRYVPMQLIYDGKTTRSIPHVNVPSFFSLSANREHLSNTDKSAKVIKGMRVP